MALERETEYYTSHLSEFIDKSGKYIVIQGENVLGIYDTYTDALQAAYKELGTDATFLVRMIEPQEPVAFFTRRIDLVCQP